MAIAAGFVQSPAFAAAARFSLALFTAATLGSPAELALPGLSAAPPTGAASVAAVATVAVPRKLRRVVFADCPSDMICLLHQRRASAAWCVSNGRQRLCAHLVFHGG